MYVWFDYHVEYFLSYFLVPMCIRSNLSFVLNHERHYMKINDLFHFSDIQCYVIFSVKMGYLWTFILEFNLLPTKNPGMLYAVGFEILNILRILNFHLPKKTCQILIML